MSPDLFIYEQYPRKVGKAKALKAIEAAVKRMVKGEAGNPPLTQREALVKLYRAVHAYAKSPAGTNPEKNWIPLPATWINQGRYMDDPSEWNVRYTSGDKGKSGQSVDAGRAYLQSLADQLSVGEDGDSPASPEALGGGLRGLR